MQFRETGRWAPVSRIVSRYIRRVKLLPTRLFLKVHA